MAAHATVSVTSLEDAGCYILFQFQLSSVLLALPARVFLSGSLWSGS